MIAPPPEFFEFLTATFHRLFGVAPPPHGPAEIGAGGSRRRYFRLGRPPRSLVGLFSPDPPADDRGVTENEAFLYVARHLGAAGVGVPAILEVRLPAGWFALEDLGETLLFDACRREGYSAGLRELYRSAVRDLAWIHARATPGFDPRRTHNPDWDAAFARRQESGYFQRAFLAGRLGWDPAGLDAELDRLASDLDPFWEPCFLYRDYQSQNIAVQDAGGTVTLRFFDFQGARFGPRQYDLASLLWDPYVSLPPDWQDGLMNEYATEAVSLEANFDPGRFREGFPLVAIHRLMQALGAYGHLSIAAGKPHFAVHVPAAVRLMARLTGQFPSLGRYAGLTRAVARLEETLDGNGTADGLKS
jgi:aminoglycoside/choline kinase family phosphotransferase